MCAKCHFRLAIYRDERLVGWSNSLPDAVTAARVSQWLRGRGHCNVIHVNTRGLTAWWEAHRGLVTVIDAAVMIRYLPPELSPRAADTCSSPRRRSFWKRALDWLMGVRPESE